MGPRFFDGIGADAVLGTLALDGRAPTPTTSRGCSERVRDAQAAGPPAGRGVRATSRPALRLGWPKPDDLAAIAAPTLVVHGDVDLVLPLAHADALAAGVPGRGCTSSTGWGTCRRAREWTVLAELVATHVTRRTSPR